MKPEATSVTVSLAGGKEISFETGKLAKQAGGSAVVRLGENVVLAAATANPDPREGIDFFPLTVDYREYTYAGGRFPGGFIKREGRMSEREVLTSRQIDRPVRPMFADGFKCETQVIAFVLSADSNNDPDVLGINGASAALTLSDIPFLGPIGAVRVGLVNGQFIVNPTYDEMRESLLNIMVVGTAEAIVMIESGAKEVKEETVVDAIEFGHTEIKKICAALKELQAKVGKAKRKVEPPQFDQAYYDDLKKRVGKDLADRLDTQKHPKAESHTLVKELKKQLQAAIPEDDEEAQAKFKHYFEKLREDIFRWQVITDKRRPDARAFDEIREIWIEVGVLPRTHGSAIFTRGETQALVTTTLGTIDDMQRIEGFEGEAKKRFMLHYNNPPISMRVVVDAKFPYDAFERSLDEEDGDVRRELQSKHARDLRSHVKTLREKSYWEAVSPAPEFVVCFIPSDFAMSAALDADPDLLAFAANERVVIVGPTNLLSLLWSVGFIVQQQQIAVNAEHIADIANKLFDRIRKVAEPVGKMGKSLDTVVRDYNTMLGSIEGRLLPAAIQLRSFGGAQRAKDLPQLATVDRLTSPMNENKWGIDDENALPEGTSEILELDIFDDE